MNKEIMKVCGFKEEVKAVSESKCPFCKKGIILSEFNNDPSRKEFKISGLCQKCQDEVFGA